MTEKDRPGNSYVNIYIQAAMSTILDVARIAHVSTATVSRVINSPEKVRDETRRRVYRAMDICRYKYNALARDFATKRSHTLGLILPTITNPIFAESTRGVQDFANNTGYQVILGNSYYQYEKEAGLANLLRERQVEGLLITTTDLKGQILKDLIDEDFPFVLLYSTVRRGPMWSVGVDNFLGGYRATEHLVRLGHRRIAMLAGSFHFSDRSYHRWHGYKSSLKEYGIPYDPALLLQTDYTLASGKKGIEKLISLDNPPTAVFCSNDFIALGAMEGAREMGLHLPEEMSIVGFDDMEISSFVVPSLTTIRQPAYEMGKLGAEALVRRLTQGSTRPVHELLETSLVIRESTTHARPRTVKRAGADSAAQ
ncbi:MAG: LacI family DNA-binding transcriptional regulator [Deltaproteobacteria bacterium]|nr:LacI family DNA-binding transcriptional regulator [Deltaproteobacteria bacterium]